MTLREPKVCDLKVLVLVAAFCLVCGPASFAVMSHDEYQHAMDLFNKGDYNGSIAVLKSSLDADPNQAMVYNLLGTIYLQQNQSIQSALGSFEQAIRIDPKFTDALFNLASTYAGPADRPELAEKYFRKTLEVDPQYVKAYFGLGWFTLTTREKPGEAAGYFEKAIANFPNFAEAYYALGLSYIQMGKAPMALQSVSKLRAMGREDLASYLELVLRGGEISKIQQAEAPAEPAAQNTAEEVQDPGLFSEETANNVPSENANPTTKSNPFKLN
jgi:tetratricopeptide (TPR) repeat protein